MPRVPWCSYKQPETDRPLSKLTPKVSQTLFCEKPVEIGKPGYNYVCTDGFRLDSTCSISCANGLSGMGRAWTVTCAGPQKGWIGETPTCDRKTFPLIFFVMSAIISAVFKLPSKTERSMTRSVKASLRLQAIVRYKYITGKSS